MTGFFIKPKISSGQAALYQTDTSVKSILRLWDNSGVPWDNRQNSPLFLNNPSNVRSTVVYDPDKNEYIIYERVGVFDIRTPMHMSPEEFRKYEYRRAMQDYWRQRTTGRESSFRSNLVPQFEVGGVTFDRVFGSNIINITPQGSTELIFGVNISRTQNPILPERLRTITTFDFKQRTQMNVTGTIGEKLQVGINYNTEAMFDFENSTKLQYSGSEDEIVKKVEAGNVTLPLKGSLITGSHSLFGLKTELQFGKITMTTIFSQQKGESSVINVRGGAQISEFEIFADNYEANRHFFLAQHFRDIYDASLKNLPIVSSGVNIEKIEVWVTNKTMRFEEANNRNIVAFMDLAENANHIYNNVSQFQAASGVEIFPSNNANQMYDQLISTYENIRNINEVTSAFAALSPDFQIGRDFERIDNARRLDEREYELNKQLGYISLNTALNTDEVLAVAYEYTLNGKLYKVGEFSTDGITAPQSLFLKLLKGTNLTPRLPTWNLMMKNIYSLGTGRVEQKDFILNVLYHDDETGKSINYLPQGQLADKILLQVMGLDNLNRQLDRIPDGFFDYIEGITINSNRGKIIFPVVEPFGSHLKNMINDPRIAAEYVFQELYDSTQTVARQMAEKNKFKLEGQYTSGSGSEIWLNAMSITQGSVKVTAGGVPLVENMDYTVDYNMGTVRIINQALLDAQTPIQVSLENNQFFGLQTKSLIGTHIDYQVSKNFDIGGTILHLNERPYTQKVNYGQEPISNTIWGMNTSYRADWQFLTKAIDKLPFISTKAPSSISFFGEFANLIPGHPKSISGYAYIDDFEASEISLDLKSFNAWTLASTPQGQEQLFPEAKLHNDLRYGYNRALLSWYVIDPLFLRNGPSTPGHIRSNANSQSSHYVREIYKNEIFRNYQSETGISTPISVLNLAFYPSERGPYNYDTEPGAYSRGVAPNGSLNAPQTRWGGMMREILTSDFESANIQYVKFWLMDPFVEDKDNPGGDFYINLGDISEDILRDSRRSFEHGLPTSADVRNVDTTAWGRVPTIQAVVNAFDNSIEARKFQDVGLDGLSDEDERSFFSDYLEKLERLVTPEAYREAWSDPSSDNFRYFRGSDYDAQQLGILDRYKRINGQEGNSPTAEMSDESYPTSGTMLPDMEDINRDNTLNEIENYYQYKISLRPNDLKVGSNYIVDEIEYEATFANGDKSKVKWYQFKIPVDEYEKVVGTKRDFKSIRFMRMYVRGFTMPTIMRFAEFDLVRAEWRKYNISLTEGGERVTVPGTEDGSFEISSVSIEENSNKTPVNYVLPPGFDRIIDPQNPRLRQLNERAMVLKVLDLPDGDARAAYKNVNLDMRQYRSLRMEVHAEAIAGQPLRDGELTAFIRLGSDYRSNFYEYEIPLKLTMPGRYDNNSDSDREMVWPRENSFVIEMSLLQEAKQERNRQMNLQGSLLNASDVFVYSNGSARISVVGNPNVSNVRVIMIGVRNPIKSRNPNEDDGNPKSGEIWVNELRLSDFVESSGWAANARLQMRLADLGTVDMVGQVYTPGWGSIEKKVNERSMEHALIYDVSTNLELGKFFPERIAMRLPVYAGYSQTIIRPKYNQLDPDIPLKDALNAAGSKAERDSIRSISEDLSTRKTFAISNAGINARGEKPQIWDLANLSVNYTYNEVHRSNAGTEMNLEKNYRGGINYNYEPRPENIMPFRNVNFLNPPALRLIKDFNFYPYPRSISFRTELNRYYNEVKTRNISNPNLQIAPSFRKDFEWYRTFDVKYDITRQLKFDFTSNNIARIDEPEGGVDKRRYRDSYDNWRDSVMTNLRHGGRNVNYNHFINVQYNIPINKLPALSWVNANARYRADYTWLAGPVFPDSLNINMGNSIKNHNEATLIAMANLSTLYSKSKFLQGIEDRTRIENAGQQQREMVTVVYSMSNVNLTAGVIRPINHNLGTRDIRVRVVDRNGVEVKGQTDILNENRINFIAEEQVEGVTITIEGRKPKKRDPLIVTGEFFIKMLMGVRSVNLTFSSSQGQYLPGYNPGISFMGMSNYNGVTAPGIPFIVGYNDPKFFDKAAQRGWISTDTLLNTPASEYNRRDIVFRTMVEPFPSLRIDITADRQYMETARAYYIADHNRNFPDSTRNRMLTGSYSISIISWGTSFEKISKNNNYVSKTFEKFKQNREIISSRRAQEHQKADPSYNPDIDPVTGILITGSYKNGYGETSRDVLIPAFIAAYTKQDPSKVTLKTFPSALRMMPNWRISFDGLSRFEFVQKVFRSINLMHQYRSVYQVASFTTNLNYQTNEIGVNAIRDMQNNFIPMYELNVVSINEQFSPLINIDMNWKNSLSTRFEWRKSRTVSLNLASNQVADARVNELIIGAGYRFNQVNVIVKTIGGGQRALRSDLNLRMDFSVRDNKTIARKLIEDVNQPMIGQKVFTIRSTADYMLSDRFNLQVFADHGMTNPFVATTFPTSNTNFGFSLKFTLM